MLTLLQICAEIIALAVMVNSSQVSAEVTKSSSKVSVEVTKSSSKLNSCGTSRTVDVVFQTVIGHASDGMQVAFERYWVSETLAALLVERLPDSFPNSNIRDCADRIAEGGHDGFEFSSGNCTAIKLSSNLCCEHIGGSHIYVSAFFDIGYEGVRVFADSTTVQSISPIVDFSKMLGASSSEDENELKPVIGKAAIEHSDGNVYTFPVDYIDVANCFSQNSCDPLIYYNRDSSSTITSPLYFTDYCGSTIPDPILFDQAILSHRGFGCEYMPNELVGSDCVVKMSFSDYSGLNMYFSDHVEGDSCDGLSLVLKQTTQSNVEEAGLCNSSTYSFMMMPSSSHEFRLSLTKQDRLGFVFGFLLRVKPPTVRRSPRY